MKRIAIATVIVALASAAPGAGVGYGPTCCACIERGWAQTSQTNNTASEALFCAAAPAGNTDALESRCEAVSDGSGALLCLVPVDEANGTGGGSNETASCRTLLAERGIDCPSSGVPAADPLNLATLAVVLGAVGVAVLRRRSSRDA